MAKAGDEVSAVRRSVTVKREGRRIGGSQKGGWTSNYCWAGYGYQVLHGG